MAILRYSGGKAKLVKKIIAHISLSNNAEAMYLEPFVGGASVALAIAAKYPKVQIVLNDKDIEIANFWNQVAASPKDQFLRLYERVRTCQPTIAQFKKLKATEAEDETDLAFRTLFFNRTGFSASNGKRPLGGWGQSDDDGTIAERWNSERLTREMFDARLLLEDRTVVFNRDFEEVIKIAGKGSIMYLDPPYYKAGNELYNHPWQDSDHIRLCEQLKRTPADWVLSYDYDPFIVELYRRMTRSYPMPTSYSISKRRGVEAIFVPIRKESVSPLGFIAPRDFAEFFLRYPDFVNAFVKRKMHHSASRNRDDNTIFMATIDDYTQDLLMFLAALPKCSKYRAMGFNDPIQLFNPGLWGGTSQKHFLAYIVMLLSNKFHTLRTGEYKDALPHADERLGSVITTKTDCIDDTQADFQTYRHFVKQIRPNLLPTFDSFSDWDSRHEIVNYASKRSKLINLLRDYFVHGRLPQRKEYKKRTK